MPALDDFFYISTDALCVLAKDGKILEASPSFESLLGFTASQLKDKSWKDLVHLDPKEEKKGTFESRMLSRDGTNKWVSWKSFQSEEGNILLVGRDITNEKASQTGLVLQNRKIAEAKARNEAILSAIGDGVVAISDKGEVIFANNQALSTLNVKSEEMLGKHLISAIKVVDLANNTLPAESHPMQRALLSGQKITTAEFSFEKKDGSKFPVAITASPVFLNQILIGGVLVFRDITREKEVDRMKTEFISLASHQLRTPLSAMKWFSEMLLAGDSGELTSEQKAMVNNIHLSNERMIDLVNSLLNISRIESGRIIIDPRPTSLQKLLEEVLLDLSPKIKKKNQDIAVNIHDRDIEISIDPKLIRHVYMNLLSNAIKYSPEGGKISVTISKSGEELISQVSDNGCGIPESQKEKIFQKFFRADNIAKVETDGTGLGLYLTKAIVDASGGRIWFASKEGVGTSFWFSLPLAGSAARQGEVSINS